MFTNLKRIIKFGWQSFSRNKGLSFAVLFVMTVSILTVTFLFFFNELSSFLISKAQEKVDISVYFKRDIEEGEILEVERGLYEFSDKIKSVDYVSKERALDIFKERHKDEPAYLGALEEVGDNPLLASLNIKAQNPTFYAQISSFLIEGQFANLIERVSYYQNEKVIDKLFSLSSNIKTGGIVLSIIFGILVVLITFNTVKLTILALREEIATMKLVGASNWFIRGPFLIQGFLYGIFSVLICDVLFLLMFSFLSSRMENWFFGFSFLNYLGENILMVILLQIVFALVLGIFSTFLAVRKYLKV